MARQTNTFISIIWSNWIHYTLWTLTTLVQCIIIALANQIACYIGFCYYVFLYCSLYILEQIHDVYISEIIRSHHISFCILCEVCTVQIFIMFLSIDNSSLYIGWVLWNSMESLIIKIYFNFRCWILSLSIYEIHFFVLTWRYTLRI